MFLTLARSHAMTKSGGGDAETTLICQFVTELCLWLNVKSWDGKLNIGDLLDKEGFMFRLFKLKFWASYILLQSAQAQGWI